MEKFKEKNEERERLLSSLQKNHGKAIFGNVMAEFMFKRDEEFFRVLYDLSELNNFTAKEIRNYMRSLYAESDYANTIDYAEKVGEARGEARGIAIGEERGIEIGTAKRSTEIAAAMLADGVDVDTICKYTDLTPEEVNALV
jgi:predicted transposase/invertase (TIGR01784 family)